MKQSSCLRTTYQPCQKVQLGSSMYQSGALPQDLINRLPDACISEILRHLEDPEDRHSCAAVCWRWAGILFSQRPDFWGPFSVHQAVHPCLHLSGADVVDAKLAAAVVGINTGDVVTDLDLRCAPRGAVVAGDPQLTDNAIHFITSACPNLNSVCLINCLSLMDKATRFIALNCPALQNFMLFQSSISDDGISRVAQQCTNLNCLHIEGDLSITKVSLRALVQDGKSLKSLALGSCPQSGEDDIMSFLMDEPYLDKLELKGMLAGESNNGVIPAYGVRLSSVLHRNLCISHHLSSLILVKCPGLQDLSMLSFSDIRFPMLQHLVIDDCSGVTQFGLMYLVGNIMNPMTLKTIKLARFYFFTYAALVVVLSLFSRTIESITLDSCNSGLVMPLYPVEAVAQECPKLKVIRLEHCDSIMDLFLAWVGMVCRGLKELRLNGLTAPVHEHGISDCFSSILQRNGITKIKLRSCLIKDMHVCIIVQSCLENLQELILDECSHILGNFVLFLRAHCPNLIKLGLSRTQINDDHIRILVSMGFEHLEEGQMGCRWITDSTMHILSSSFLPELWRVNIADCPQITQDTIDYYQGFWKIKN